MKKCKLYLVCIASLLTCTLNAQNDALKTTKGLIGITFSSLGTNDVANSQDLIGGPGYFGDKFYSIGISYVYPLNHTFDLETGIEYSNQKILVESAVMPTNAHTSTISKLSIISLPVSIRLNFLKYCFINGGVFLGSDMSNTSPIEKQNGIGTNLGLGLKYDFKCGFSAFVNPYAKMHSLISFSSSDNHQRLMESGFRFGLMYRL
jgi:hypothetical protein